MNRICLEKDRFIFLLVARYLLILGRSVLSARLIYPANRCFEWKLEFEMQQMKVREDFMTYQHESKSSDHIEGP